MRRRQQPSRQVHLKVMTHDGGGSPGRTSIAPFPILGCVVDASGNPVAGAALRVDDQLVFTDSRGLFEVRRSGAKARTIEAALGEFMFPGVYEVISMPATVRPASGDGSIVRIVLRRVE